MAEDAQWCIDLYWSLDMFEQSIRYTKIRGRILQAMSNGENKLIYC